MVNYKNTVIYRIPVGDKNYYGHTAQPLHKRKHNHKYNFKKGCTCEVYKAMREIGMTADKIELIWVEDFPCENRNQALARERYWVENYGTLNNIIPSRTRAEYRAYNREKIAEYNAEYYANNRDKIAEYLSNNRETIAVKRAKYYAAKKLAQQGSTHR